MTSVLRLLLAAAFSTAAASKPQGPEPLWRQALAPPEGDASAVREADRLIVRADWAAASAALSEARGAAGELLKARIARGTGRLVDVAAPAGRALAEADGLAELAALELGLAALAQKDAPAAVTRLLPLMNGPPAVAEQAALPLVEALSASDPAALLSQAAVIEKALPKSDLDARSVWLAALAQAHERLGQVEAARAVQVRRFLEEPVSLKTPATPPAGAALTLDQLLARAEKLLDAHRNERVLEALEPTPTEGLTPGQRCRRELALGLASRKLRHYANAEKYLTAVTDTCRDVDWVRRAMYLNAKVISIRDGLRAVPVMDLFAKKFAGHSMVDDVLFWAGDLYERRQRWSEAEKYYKRIESSFPNGDHCAEASWRQAWMAYRRGKLKTAETRLSGITRKDGCVGDRFDRARAHYWLGRLAHETGRAGAPHYRNAIDLDPLGYYGQLGLARLSTLDATAAAAVTAKLPVPAGDLPASLCAGFLEQDTSFQRGVRLLTLGLASDAAAELRAVAVPEQQVLADTHASALGVAAKPAQTLAQKPATTSGCSRNDALLLLTLLFDRAGAYREAHWRLRTDFADRLDSYPTTADGALWRAAYPLAYRDSVEPAELEGRLPPMFLQALAREESALDAQAVSWAGAYGLTQLLLESGRAAGKLLSPPVEVARAEDLLDPHLNARLGATLLGSQVRKFGGNLGLALSAYNAGDDTALIWWKRHAGAPFDVFAEEITIKETRGYVKRVLKTFGIYRWLYAGATPTLPIEEKLPARD